MSQPDKLYHKMAHPAGVAFSVTNPLIDHWLSSWNTTNPLLDIGCGNCHNSLIAVNSGARVYATEIDEGSLQLLQQEHHDKANQLSFHQAKLPDDIPLPDNYFSGILCSEVFHFLNHEETLASIHQLRRLLIPGGKVVLTCACEESQAFKPVNLKGIKESQRQKHPDRLDPVDDFLNLIDQAISHFEPDHEAWELRDLARSIMPRSFFNFFNPGQLACAFSDAGFRIDLITTGPALYYPVWEHGDHDQVRLVAGKR
ncbi:class I SAM-dependent methyltransferase [Endozoicomonas lisbonensis]|uniref:SAM-dependent methyltransferase n=1 Tax=Endozoicomonas lisbonensis TaxID=3120522 RepID=A0ABV2SEY2_9GAMM